ncbi:MAG: fatty acid desaturase [Alphaproteobacteria bacterium]|nr:fatty acid desaturase [Alphaproteobacteria bacterium]
MSAAKSWAKRLAPYRVANNGRAIFELTLTAALFLALWVASAVLYHHSVLASLALAVPTAAFLVRLFMVQHDCGHLAMFTSRQANDWVGRAIGFLTLTPYDYWKHTHAQHHMGSGNLDRRGVGDINTLTLAEYQALGLWGRFRYRLYRHPLVMFGLGPIYLFLIAQRFPLDTFRNGRAAWLSVFGTNAAILAGAGLMMYLIGIPAFLVVHVPVVILGAAAGVWLFYVQHQFDGTQWKRSVDWNKEQAALNGSSFYDLPKPLMWLTGNIGIHHLHHLSSRIPFYRLPQVLKDYPELKSMGRVTLWQSLKCVKLNLWDEGSQRLISFREAHRLMLAGAGTV